MKRVDVFHPAPEAGALFLRPRYVGYRIDDEARDVINRIAELELAIMTVVYLRSLARRCLAAARQSFDVRAIEEFRKLAAEFTQKADELERANLPVVLTKRNAAEPKSVRR